MDGIDSITKKEIPFVAISFRNNNGFYTDENRFFDI